MRATTPRNRPGGVETYSSGRMRVPRLNDETPRNLSPRQATQVSMGKTVIPKINQTQPRGETFKAAAAQTPYKSQAKLDRESGITSAP